MGFIPRLGRSSGGGNGKPLQYSCLGNPIDRSPAGYSPWGHKESDSWAIEHAHTHTLKNKTKQRTVYELQALALNPILFYALSRQSLLRTMAPTEIDIPINLKYISHISSLNSSEFPTWTFQNHLEFITTKTKFCFPICHQSLVFLQCYLFKKMASTSTEWEIL